MSTTPVSLGISPLSSYYSPVRMQHVNSDVSKSEITLAGRTRSGFREKAASGMRREPQGEGPFPERVQSDRTQRAILAGKLSAWFGWRITDVKHHAPRLTPAPSLVGQATFFPESFQSSIQPAQVPTSGRLQELNLPAQLPVWSLLDSTEVSLGSKPCPGRLESATLEPCRPVKSSRTTCARAKSGSECPSKHISEANFHPQNNTHTKTEEGRPDSFLLRTR